MNDTLDLYRLTVAESEGTGHYPPVAVDESLVSPMMVCANGHRWGAITPEEGCPVCIRYEELRRKGRTECEVAGCNILVECSDRLWEQGVRKCQGHWIDDGGWTAGPISIDGYAKVIAQYMPRNRWNGWVCPWLDAWSCVKVLEEINDPDYDPTYTWHWEDDATLVLNTHEEGNDETYAERLVPDEDGLYALGSHFWVWHEDDEEEEDH